MLESTVSQNVCTVRLLDCVRTRNILSTEFEADKCLLERSAQSRTKPKT